VSYGAICRAVSATDYARASWDREFAVAHRIVYGGPLWDAVRERVSRLEESTRHTDARPMADKSSELSRTWGSLSGTPPFGGVRTYEQGVAALHALYGMCYEKFHPDLTQLCRDVSATDHAYRAWLLEALRRQSVRYNGPKWQAVKASVASLDDSARHGRYRTMSEKSSELRRTWDGLSGAARSALGTPAQFSGLFILNGLLDTCYKQLHPVLTTGVPMPPPYR